MGLNSRPLYSKASVLPTRPQWMFVALYYPNGIDPHPQKQDMLITNHYED